jgi:hypothetical protein
MSKLAQSDKSLPASLCLSNDRKMIPKGGEGVSPFEKGGLRGILW